MLGEKVNPAVVLHVLIVAPTEQAHDMVGGIQNGIYRIKMPNVYIQNQRPGG